MRRAPLTIRQQVAGFLSSARGRRWLALVALAVLVAAVYAPALGFTFYEEDPSDFGESRGMPLGELFAINTSGLFYRPLHLAFFQLISVPFDFDPFPAHVIHLSMHLAGVWMLYVLLKRVLGQPEVSLAGAALLAVHPMAAHGVARLTASQVEVTPIMLAALALYAEVRLSGRKWAGWLSVALLAVGLLFQETAAAVLPMALLLEWYFVRTGRVERFAWKTLAGFGVAILGFLAVWLQIEKSGSGFLEEGFSYTAALYLLQAVVYPFARGLAALSPDPSLAAMSAVYALGLAALGGWYALRGRTFEFGMLFVFYASVVVPSWAAKEFGYFIYAHRTLNVGLPYVAALWAGLLLAPGPGELRWPPLERVPRRMVMVTLAALGMMALLDTRAILRLHAVGSDVMRQVVEAQVAEPDRRLLYVNVPDRFSYERQPLPIGDWGMIVAPVSMDLSRYGNLRYGLSAETRSATAWQLAAGDVERTPYQVTTRGPDEGPGALYEDARSADSVYVVDYLPSAFAVRRVGAVEVGSEANEEPLATFGEAAHLLDAEAALEGDGLHLTLLWASVGGALPDDTVFVHVSGPDFVPVAQADGDALGGLLPLTAWQAGDIIVDERYVGGLPPGDYALVVGLYSRATGERLSLAGASVPEVIPGGVQVGQVHVPG